MNIELYTKAHKTLWDEFICKSKNATFLLLRNYMDYHQERFRDYSLLVYDQNQLIALLPANLEHGVLHSHQGLTYGGFITNTEMTAPKMLNVFQTIIKFLIQQGIKQLCYKTIPSIYYKVSADEDKYALFLSGATLYRRDLLTVVTSSKLVKIQQRRQRMINKAQKNNLTIKEVKDFSGFWEILTENLLSKHQAKPVHSITEIELLHSHFPQHIRLFACFNETSMLAGVVIYETEQVAHAQYIAATDQGRMIGALDLLFFTLLQDVYKTKAYFDFGISNEQNGSVLNQGLIDFKEGFGGRALAHDYYQLELTDDALTQLDQARL